MRELVIFIVTIWALIVMVDYVRWRNKPKSHISTKDRARALKLVQGMPRYSYLPSAVKLIPKPLVYAPEVNLYFYWTDKQHENILKGYYGDRSGKNLI